MIKDEYYVLGNGVSIPKVAFGTWQVSDGDESYNAVSMALKAGYKHIDTAFAYQNEKSVGRAIKDSKINREDIFITTKLPAEIKTRNEALECFNASLENLDTSYIDLYLIHAPWPWSNVGMDCTKENIEIWKLFIELYNAKKIKAIGVSNFLQKDIEALIEATSFVPHVNQIRFFIGNTQKELVSYCKNNNILVEAYSPLATGHLLEDEKIKAMALKYNTTIPKICLRYCIDSNTLVIPKSVHEERIIANIDINFTISKEDMEYLDSITCKDELKRPLRS